MKKSAFIVDAIALVLYAVAANPSITGFSLHEWFGLAALVVFIAHSAMHADWIANAVKRAFRQPSLASTGRLALDILLTLSLVICCVSGVLESGEVLRKLGYFADGYYFWNPLHAASAKVLLALILVHIVLHVRQVVSFAKRRGSSNASKDK